MFQLQAACLPITALRPIIYEHQTFVLAGHGPYLCVYDHASRLVECKLIFQTQPIHGIVVTSTEENLAVPQRVTVVLWGGRRVRYGELTIGSNESKSSVSKAIFALREEFDAQDWILKVASVTINLPKPSQRPARSIFLLTAHNALLEFTLQDCSNSDLRCCHFVRTIQGPKSFLYAGDIQVVNADHLILASGTVFGEIITWTCHKTDHSGQWLSTTRKRYNGHRGSIFGVTISEALDLNGESRRLMASCSDDRTIRVWDISDCDHFDTQAGSNNPSSNTGFGDSQSDENYYLASAWGHLSRIWNVEFATPQTRFDREDLLIISRGEDATCQLWSLTVNESSTSQPEQLWVLSPLTQDRHHGGKNIWSMAQLRFHSATQVYTGGADGSIILRDFEAVRNQSMLITQPFKTITGSAKALKHYILFNHGECLAATDDGLLFDGAIAKDKEELLWTQVLNSSSRARLVICSLNDHNLALVASLTDSLCLLDSSNQNLTQFSLSPNETITWMKLANQAHSVETSAVCMVAMFANNEAALLWLNLHTPIVMHKTSLQLPETFTITAVCYSTKAQVLILGSRAGALAVYIDVAQRQQESKEYFCFRHVHGEDCVTSIRVLDMRPKAGSVQTNALYILTTGRDGFYAVHCIELASETGTTQPILSTLHLSSPPFGPNIEGSYFRQSTTLPSSRALDLILYGFRSTSFIVWNETQQATMLSVDCGGSHRSWSYSDSGSHSNGISSDALLEAATTGEMISDWVQTFVWTKARCFNWHKSTGANHTSVLKGGHGREIKTVAARRNLSPDLRWNYLGLPIIATGAEDTNIQLFTLPPNSVEASDNTSFDSFRSLAILKGHTTGLQHLLFSSAGNYLFSSAGCEEFFVWKLSFNVPCIGVGVVLWDQMPKEDEDSDARIMSFDIRELYHNLHEGDNYPAEFTIAMAYSNGKTKIVRYLPTHVRKHGSFETLREISYGSICIMHAMFLSPSRPSDTSQSHSLILSAGTNGFLNFSASQPHRRQSEGSSLEVHRVHQSSILCIDAVRLTQDSWLIATGGDDNALGFTVVSLNLSHNSQQPLRLRSLLIPKAHAAALTALRTTGLRATTSGYSLKVVTVGNDQRVKIWSVSISSKLVDQPDDRLLNGLEVQRLGIAWTAVADVSAIELVGVSQQKEMNTQDQGNGCLVTVVGVGMQLLRIE